MEVWPKCKHPRTPENTKVRRSGGPCCRQCCRARDRRRYADHREAFLEYHRQKYLRNSARIKKRVKKYQSEHPEQARAYRAKNRDRIRERRRANDAKNPDRVRERRRRREALNRGYARELIRVLIREHFNRQTAA